MSAVDRHMQSVRVMPDEYVRGKLSDPAFLDRWFAALEDRLNAGKRDAIRLVAEMLKLVGAPVMVQVQIAQRFGVRDETELRTLVESGRQLSELSELGDAEQAAMLDAALFELLSRRPDLRGQCKTLRLSLAAPSEGEASGVG